MPGPDPRRARALLVLMALLGVSAASAAAGVTVPFVTVFDAATYDAHVQNWAVAQGTDGVVYFGNTEGVLSFDGVRWELVPMPNESIVRSLAVDSAGTVWVGAVDELGYLARDAAGRTEFVSLRQHLPPEHRQMGDVWRCFATPTEICFWADSTLMRWRRDRFELTDCPSSRVPGMVDGVILNNLPGLGLQALHDGGFQPLPGGRFTADLDVTVLLPFDRETLLIGTRSAGLFLFAKRDSESTTSAGTPPLRPFPTAVDDQLIVHRLYHGTTTAGGNFALATMTGGALIIDTEGRLLHRLDRSSGLPDRSVWYAQSDSEGGLWLALNRGLARAELSSRLSVVATDAGLDGTVESVLRHRGTLYAGTSTGLYRLRGDRFELVPGPQPPYWTMLEVATPSGQQLLIGSYDGVHILSDGHTRSLLGVRNAFELALLPSRPGIVAVGHASGLDLLRFGTAGWSSLGAVPDVTSEIRSIAEDPSGRVWLGTAFDGLRSFELDLEPRPTTRELSRVGLGEGLPTVRGARLIALPETLLVGTPAGVRETVAGGHAVRPTKLLGSDLLLGKVGIFRMVASPGGDLWLSLYDHQPMRAHRNQDGSYEVEDVGLGRLPRVEIYDILPEADGTVWLGTARGLFSFDGTRPRHENSPPRILIRAVTTDHGDRLELPDLAAHTTGGSDLPIAQLHHDDNSLQFLYASPSFDELSSNRFSYRLDGYDESWSAWERDTKKEYINLAPASYCFRVRARDVFGAVSEEASFPFVIRPAWYQTVWVRAAALIAILAAIWGVVRWRSAALVTQRDRLEQQVAKRTEELERSRDELETAHRIIAAINSETEFEELTHTILEQLHIIPAVEGACILALDDSTRRLRLRAASGPERHRFIEMERSLELFERQFLDGAVEVAQQVFLLGGEGGEHVLSSAAASLGFLSAIVVRFEHGSDVEGFLVLVNHSTTRAFDDEDLSLVSHLREDILAAFHKARLLRDVQSLSERKSEVLRMAAHDFRSPMATIMSHLRVLAERIREGHLDEDAAVARLTRLESTGERAIELLERLLDLSVVENEAEEMQLGRIDLRKLLEQCETLYRDSAESKGISLEVERDAELPDVYADPVRIAQVLDNLVSNAIKYTHPGGSVRLRCSNHGDALVTSIEDTGQGLSDEDKSHVFRSFRRLSARPTGGEPSTGVGLAIARTIVERHGGRIWVESQKDRGSTFHFSLPLAKPNDPDHDAASR